ncbi:MAG: FAD-dependent oxidoreductase, partial [Verrucomicrobia bacterium]|nr:FAD-dependent oxidoreductase [Verrucomicrobiota bacterium]
ALLTLGARVGAAAAVEAKGRAVARAVRVAATAGRLGGIAGARTAPGEVREFLTGLRPTESATQRIPSSERPLPVLGTYDVVIVGGGTGGAPAGIAAGRSGARTLLLEYLHGLGGVGTMGMISRYYHGYRGGFTAEIDKGVAALKATNDIVGKAEWWRRTNREAGTEIWFGVLGGGTIVHEGVVRGVVVATPEGRGVVLARTVIDSTGNADVAAAAGARCSYTDGDEASVQGTGLPPWELGASYTNTDWTFADDTDVVDFWHHFVLARQKFPHAYDVGQLVDTRERRRIVGDVTISPTDVILGRTWPDTVSFAKSNFDSHGFTVHPVFVAMPPDKQSLSVSVPLRALLPQGFDGLLVTGLGASAHRDAMPVIRMQPDVQNQGYACGVAAAMVAKAGTTIRHVDLKALQQHLVAKECLPPSALTDQDLLLMPAESVVRAVDNLTRVEPITGPAEPPVDGAVRNRQALAVIFAHPKEAIPLLTAAHARTSGEEKLACAHVLAMLGSNAGADTLVKRLQAAPGLDQGWNFRGMGQFGRSLSELDSYLVALSRTGDPRTVEAALAQLQRLSAAAPFSHHRACAMALERMGDARAAAPLAALLRQPGMAGFATPDLAAARRQMRPSPTDNVQRNESLRELVLARALFRCGDHEGLGARILREYATDLRGHYARHAQAVLAAGRTRR